MLKYILGMAAFVGIMALVVSPLSVHPVVYAGVLGAMFIASRMK